jgi:hypothetical protein
MTEAASTEVVAWLRGYRSAIAVKINERLRDALAVSLRTEPAALLLLTDVSADHFPEPAFRLFPKLFVVGGLLADYESSAAVAGIEPHDSGSGASIRAVKSYPRPRLYEWTTDPKLGGLFVLHAHQGGALVIFLYPNRADGHFGPGRCLTDGMPVTRRKRHQADKQHRRQHNCYQNSEGFLQVMDNTQDKRSRHSRRKKPFCQPPPLAPGPPMLSLLAQKPV